MSCFKEILRKLENSSHEHDCGNPW